MTQKRGSIEAALRAAIRAAEQMKTGELRIVISPEFGGPPVKPRPFDVEAKRAEIAALALVREAIAKAKSE